MKNVLLVDCCLRGDDSRTARLADAFVRQLRDCRVTRLALEQEPLQPLTGQTLRQRQALLSAGQLDDAQFRWAHQFAEADAVVIAAPFWDLSFPALLKIYIERICVEGITFRTSQEGLQGLCRGSDLILLTTRGGFYGDGPMELGSRYWDALHTFFGFGRYHCVYAEGLDAVSPQQAQTLTEEAAARAALLAQELSESAKPN